MHFNEKNPLKPLFEGIKEEMNEHLNAINDNTNEIQANYEYLCEIDSKVEKLKEMLDSLLLAQKEQKKYVVDKLTSNEQQAFIALYALEEEKGAVSYLDIAKKIGIPVNLVQTYVVNLIEKGIPVQKRYINNTAFLTLEPDFKSTQRRNNILNLNPAIAEVSENKS